MDNVLVLAFTYRLKLQFDNSFHLFQIVEGGLSKNHLTFLHLFLLGKLEINEAFSLRTMHALLFRGPIRVGNTPGFN